MRRARAASKQKVAKKSTTDDDPVELEEIMTRLNGIVERSNRIDQQLGDIERKRQRQTGQTGQTETQTASRISQTRMTTAGSPPHRPIITTKRLGGSTLSSDIPKPSHPVRPIAHALPKTGDITIEDVFRELVALRREVADVASTQQEMKRDIDYLKSTRH